MSDLILDRYEAPMPANWPPAETGSAAPITPRPTAMSRPNKGCEACGELGRYVVAGKCRSCGHMMGEQVTSYWNRL